MKMIIKFLVILFLAFTFQSCTNTVSNDSNSLQDISFEITALQENDNILFLKVINLTKSDTFSIPEYNGVYCKNILSFKEQNRWATNFSEPSRYCEAVQLLPGDFLMLSLGELAKCDSLELQLDYFKGHEKLSKTLLWSKK